MKNMHMGGVQTGELGRFSGADTQGPEAFHTYMFLHKRFGSEKPARLVELGCAMSGSHMPHVLQAAGSAIREGIMFLPLRTEHSIDSIYEGKRQGDLCQLDKAQAA